MLRTLKYSRYLADYGWRVSVIAPRADAYAVTDEKLVAQVPSHVRVVRTGWLNTKRHISIGGVYPAILALPDAWIGWWPYAVAAGRRIVREDPVDLVYSTSPHATAHLIAMRISHYSALPWVADFRDPWVEDPPEPGSPNGPIYRTINRWLEHRALQRCTRIVTSTSHLRDLLQARYPDLTADKFTAISNGFDEADFVDVVSAPSARSEELLVVHAGSINPEFRDPRPLFQALRTVIDAGAVNREQVRLRFIGGGEFGHSAPMREALAATGLAGRVEFAARMPYKESLRELGRADLLLLLQASEDTVGLVPAKLYEYLRSKRPVLALVRQGATSEVLRETGGGWDVDPRDQETLKLVMEDIFSKWRRGDLAREVADPEALRRYDRRALAGQLADVFEDACGAKAGKS